MVALYKDPQGKNVFNKIKQQVIINTNTINSETKGSQS